MCSRSVYSLSAMILLVAVGRDGSARQAVWQGETHLTEALPGVIFPPYSKTRHTIRHADTGEGASVSAWG